MRKTIKQLYEQGEGVFSLAPTWVPRSFCRPGKRIKLYPSDYYALGLERGGIDERWFASTTRADNGPGTPEDEGLSYITDTEARGNRFLLAEAIDYFQDKAIGPDLWQKYKRWPMFSKFFDNAGPLPHHIHHREEHAAKVNQAGKPEMYFFPAQMNNHPGEFPLTFFGLNPETKKTDLLQCLTKFTSGDNDILDLSRSYKLTLDTGWDVPPGVLHAPGSLCTYEPQFASDVFAMYQSVLYGGQCVSEDLLWKDSPVDKRGDYTYLIDILDWDLNVDPDFHEHRFMAPIPVRDTDIMAEQGYYEEWICYRCSDVSAKRLTIFPGCSVTLQDSSAYGFILLQGYGTCGVWPIETPTLIHYGQNTADEFFITYHAAREGVKFTNKSSIQPLVLLKHFAENPDLPSISIGKKGNR